ncbi:MAG: alpha/beta hydrolase, partial [Mesorhizobium sp.]
MTAHATTEGFSDYRGYRTWYRVIGDLNTGKLPLVI